MKKLIIASAAIAAAITAVSCKDLDTSKIAKVCEDGIKLCAVADSLCGLGDSATVANLCAERVVPCQNVRAVCAGFVTPTPTPAPAE